MIFLSNTLDVILWMCAFSDHYYDIIPKLEVVFCGEKNKYSWP
jgi:hypothetical protein